MKTILFVLFLFGIIQGHANKIYDVRVDQDSYSYVDTLCVPPDVAYSNAQNWILKSSVSYKGSVQYENREQKKLIAKSGTAFPYEHNSSNVESFLIFDLTIEIRDGKYRIKLDNIKGLDILHGFKIGMLEVNDESEDETDIPLYSGYWPNEVSGVIRFGYDVEYENNKLQIQKLEDMKDVVKKKKEQEAIDKKIAKIKYQQEFIDKERDKYISINSTINNYIDLLSKQLNYNDDF